MSLRGALASLPDDRVTHCAARTVVTFIAHHAEEPLDVDRVARVTGVPSATVDELVRALADGYVVDCGGPCASQFVYHPDALLSLEMDRYLRTSSVVDRELRTNTDRFRSRFGR